MPRRRPGDYGRKGIFRDALGKSYQYDSTWERRRMQTLDLNGYHFTREGVRIPYIFNNQKRTYYPDLVVYDRFWKLLRIEEIKPSVRNNDPQNIAKWEAARAWCQLRGIEFRIVNEKDLSKP
jgi:hypothetical protein